MKKVAQTRIIIPPTIDFKGFIDKLRQNMSFKPAKNLKSERL